MPSKRLHALRRALKQAGDPDDARFLQRFFKTGPGGYAEGDRFIGVRVPRIRALVQPYVDLPISDVRVLLTSPLHEERLLALLLLVRQYQRGDDRARRAIYQLYLFRTRHINNWDLVDLSAEHIVGAYLRERSRKPLYRLARSRNLWERRIAVLATFHFIKRNDFDDLLALAERLLGDHEDLIHKAVGWMLREVGKRDLAVEEAFLRRHGRVMPRTMLRYAIERFPEKKRRAYLAGTAAAP